MTENELNRFDNLIVCACGEPVYASRDAIEALNGHPIRRPCIHDLRPS